MMRLESYVTQLCVLVRCHARNICGHTCARSDEIIRIQSEQIQATELNINAEVVQTHRGCICNGTLVDCSFPFFEKKHKQKHNTNQQPRQLNQFRIHCGLRFPMSGTCPFFLFSLSFFSLVQLHACPRRAPSVRASIFSS